jgi:hypothetical protein
VSALDGMQSSFSLSPPPFCGSQNMVMPADRLPCVPKGAFVGPGASSQPPVYSARSDDTHLVWEGRARCGRKLQHVGRHLTREVRRLSGVVLRRWRRCLRGLNPL